MNKTKRKIQLSRESIRVLTASQLGGLGGAGTTTGSHSVFCPSYEDDCPFPSHGPCSLPCSESDGLRCY